jgi:hypothetical protein
MVTVVRSLGQNFATEPRRADTMVAGLCLLGDGQGNCAHYPAGRARPVWRTTRRRGVRL